ncbi:MAG: histidine kinase dimerization/phospho-acceptor domain-containing protein, partial [Coriobacteriales bacterium]
MTDRTLGWAGRYRTRMTLGYVLVVALLALVWGWSLYGPLTDAVTDQQQGHLQSVAQAGALVVSEHPSDLESAVRGLVAGTGLRMTVIAADGEVLADSSEDPRSMANHANRPEVAEALTGRVGHDVRLSATQNIEQMYVAVPARIGDRRVVVRVSESLASISELSASARRTGLAILIAGVAAALLIGGWIARSTARPVEQLADAACAMAAGDLTSPIPAGSGPLEPLASALKQLREQMRERIDALESERKSLRSVVDGLQDAVLLLEDDVITLHNRAAVLLLRSRPAELQGRRLADTPLSASLVAAIKSALAEGGTVLRDLAPDPLQRSLRLAVVPLGTSGDRSRTLVIVSDITERTVLDSMRRDFVTNASHELKTPTAGILLLAQSAAQAAADGDKDRALGFLAQIEHEAQRLRQLVLDLLDLSRFEGPAARDEVTDVRQAVELSVTAHRRSATEK